MRFHSFLLYCLFITFNAAYSQETLQSVTDNGNTTNKIITIDPQADAFRSFNVNRLNSTFAATSSAALANNRTYTAITWHPDITVPSTTYALYVGGNILNYYNNGTVETVWRSGNMGAGSGLNADMVDGLHASSLFRYGNSAFGDPTAFAYPSPGLYFNYSFQPANGIPNNNYGAYLYLGNLSGDAQYSGIIAFGTNSGNLYTKRKTAGTWETSWRTIWDSNNFNPAQYLQLTGGNITGDLTIGANTSQKQLNVNGNIKARKIKVSIVDWPDYVFENDYQLPELKELSAFIRKNRHLPDIPSAAEVEKDGLDLGEMNQKLLKKIEELTLYIFEQDEKYNALQKRTERLEALLLQ